MDILHIHKYDSDQSTYVDCSKMRALGNVCWNRPTPYLVSATTRPRVEGLIFEARLE